MKLSKTFVALLAIGLLALCSRSVNSQQLEERDGLMYEINQLDPYSGKVETFYENGQKQIEAIYVDGREHGLRAAWYENGQKMLEKNYVHGKPHGKKEEWYESGKKWSEKNYVDGKEHGKYERWYEMARRCLRRTT
jgi:antitoxin component YwqK of YwqJK toxin-antitoxin module